MDDDVAWLRRKADFAPSEETEKRFKAVADRLEGYALRLDAIRKIVEPTGAYLFSGHVNALAEIRALLVENQLPERCSRCGHGHNIGNPCPPIPDERRQTCRHCGGFIPCQC